MGARATTSNPSIGTELSTLEETSGQRGHQLPCWSAIALGSPAAPHMTLDKIDPFAWRMTNQSRPPTSRCKVHAGKGVFFITTAGGRVAISHILKLKTRLQRALCNLCVDAPYLIIYLTTH